MISGIILTAVWTTDMCTRISTKGKQLICRRNRKAEIDKFLITMQRKARIVAYKKKYSLET